MYTVEFFTVKYHLFGEKELVHHVIKTGKTDMNEAYDVALVNGHNPNKNIRIYWED